jgi:hypothetical protein
MLMPTFGHECRPHRWLSLPVCVALVSLVAPAHAAMIVTVGSKAVSPGTSGNTLDVTLANTGASAVSIAGFQFEVTVPSSSIIFTAVNTSTTAPYIFAGNSLFGPNILNPPPTLPGQAVSAYDIFMTPNAGVSLGAGSSVGLGHLLFNVASTAAPGPITVALLGSGATALSDPNGISIPLGTLNSGTITVGAGSVPAPTSLLMGLIAAAALIAVRRIWIGPKAGCASFRSSPASPAA